MSVSHPRRPARPSPSRVAIAAVVTLLGSMLAVLGASAPAQSETTVSPVEPGSPPVVRDSSVDVTVDVGALHYYRSSSSSAFNPTQPSAHVFNTQTCRGDNPGGTNNSARTVVTVTDPDGATIANETSPVRDMGLAGFVSNPPHQPLSPQPAPGNSNYRGDFPGTANTHHGMKLTLDLTGKPAGEYTVRTAYRNTVRTGFFGACSVGTPGPGNSIIPGEVIETDTFVYRPWQHTFKDVLGNGNVRANITPREFTFKLGSLNSPIYQGTSESQSFYSLDGAFMLPSDPEACVADVTACLPSSAVTCEPTAGCTPRLMVINEPDRGDRIGIIGVFDFETKAFIASAMIDGTTRVLVSLGTTNDGLYHSLLEQLAADLDAQGLDLMAILGTRVEVANEQNQISLSLLNGLQIDPSNGNRGIRIFTPGTVQAGVILDVYASLRLDGGACVTNAASSSDGPTRYTRNEDNGYTVNRTDLLPSVPRVGPLGAIVGGPVYSIRGKFTTAGTASTLANVSTAVIGVDTAADEPNGYPVWISPFVSGIRTGAPKTMDFLGTATWSASESPILAGCMVIDFMLGTGVAIYDSPLPVGLWSLIDVVGTPSPELEALQASVDTAVQGVLDTVTSDPTVDALLGDLVALLPLSSL